MDRLAVIILVFLIIFFFLAIAFIILYANANIYRIDPNECYTSQAPYSIETGRTAPILTNCLTNGSTGGLCTFPMTSLYSAIQFCDANPLNCNVFSFDGETMSFLETILTASPDPTTIVYLKNYSILF